MTRCNFSIGHRCTFCIKQIESTPGGVLLTQNLVTDQRARKQIGPTREA
jgi:hypothetical protein